MDIKAGAKLGPYEIVSAIGKGGMGEVWQARDSRLGRDVAIKISAQRFSDRFEREARSIAALNHPNICTLYDVGPDYLVMELVEGPTLADRIAEGPLPVEEALRIARQIGDALEAAHEKGIVHRDLKPANVKIRPDGSVKVLDFGLAKMPDASTVTSDSPTMLSAQGMILGTASYMAPEQARGKNIDKRADIFAFGAVLYEMLTGKKLFRGEDVTEILASVIRDEPNLAETPASVRRLISECLQKDPRKRLRDIGDAWKMLDDTAASAQPGAAPLAAAPQRNSWLWPAVAGVFLLTTGALAFVHFRETPPAVAPTQFQIMLPPKTALSSFSLSPDGRKIIFQLRGQDGRNSLWLRRMDSLDIRELPGTAGAFDPTWSPNSQFVAFTADDGVKKLDISGGSPQTLAPFANPGAGLAWSRQDVILYSSSGILNRVSASGGEVTPVTVLDTKHNEVAHLRPFFLPDGKHFLYFRVQSEKEKSGIFVGSLDSKAAEQETTRLLDSVTAGIFVPSAGTRSGYLAFMRGDSLMAQPFDPDKRRFIGSPLQLADRVSAVTYGGTYSLSNNGVLAHAVTGGGARQLTWFDRQGKILGRVGDAASRDELMLSPDGTRIAEGRVDERGIWVVWALDLARGISTRLTFEGGGAGNGIWSPDGSQIVYAPGGGQSVDLYVKPASGAGLGQLLYHSDQIKTPMDWSRDGRYVLFAQRGKGTGLDLYVLPMQGEHKPTPYLVTPFNEGQAMFSPDGHWVVYTSNETGKKEVYVQPFPMSTGGKWPVSNGGGSQPRWSKDGKELFYFGPDSTLMAVSANTNGGTFQPGAPKPLFRTEVLGGDGGAPSVAWRWDVTKDGRFLINTALDTDTSSPVTILLNWQSGLK